MRCGGSMAKEKFVKKTFLYSKEKVPNLVKMLKGESFTLHHIGKSDAKRKKFFAANDESPLGILTNLLLFLGNDYTHVCEVDDIDGKFITSFVLSEKFDAIYQCKSIADAKFIKTCSDSAYYSTYIDDCLKDSASTLSNLDGINKALDDSLLDFIVEQRLSALVESLMHELAYDQQLLTILNNKVRVFPLS
jgi:hypothetical protein